VIERYVRWMDRLYVACVWIAGVALGAMTIIIPWGVYARYILGTGSQWPEPLAILLMIVFTFFAAAACYRADVHIAVKLLTGALPEPLRRRAARAVDVLMAALSLFIVIWGFQLCWVTWYQVIAEFPWLRAGITYLPLPIGALVTLLFIIERLLAGPQEARAVVSLEHRSTGN
jgi:TRAP-type C4-dicarboxylate transport system permease small subunit